MLSLKQIETPKVSNNGFNVSVEDGTRKKYRTDLRSRETNKATKSDQNIESNIVIKRAVNSN